MTSTSLGDKIRGKQEVERRTRMAEMHEPHARFGDLHAPNRFPSAAAIAAQIRESRIPAVNIAQVPQRSPLRYPGGKTWLIPHIREWLGSLDQHPEVLIEPFAGGGIVSLTTVMEGYANQAVMAEIDRDVAAFWHAVLREGETLAHRVRDFTPTRARARKIEQTAPENVLDHGFRTLVLNRTRRGGILAKGASFTRKGENGKGVLSRWYPETLATRIEAIARHADRILFLETDGVPLLDLMLRAWGKRAVVFIDPPYTIGGKRAGSRLYDHNTIDHTRIFAMLAESSASFLMTYDAAPEALALTRRHGFHAVTVRMKNTHHDRLPELVITREKLFS